VNISLNDEQIERYIQQIPQGFQLGSSSRFLFNFATQRFIYVERTIQDITGYDAVEFTNSLIQDTFSLLLHPEQGVITTRVHQECYRSLTTEFAGRMDVHVNMDYAIKTRSGESRRLLSQFMPMIWEGASLILVGGCFTDITSLRRDGQPTVNISLGGQILRQFEPYVLDLVKERLTEFTLRELEILKLTSNGATTEEIAAHTGVSKATVYAHRRNILAKSEFRSIPKLIEALRFRGIL
jgi:DNA-binding CsgD family transcriptional regulator